MSQIIAANPGFFVVSDKGRIPVIAWNINLLGQTVTPVTLAARLPEQWTLEVPPSHDDKDMRLADELAEEARQ